MTARKPWTPRPAESALHKALVASLVQLGATVGGFRRGVEAAVGATFENAPKIVPDAWLVESDRKRVVALEVCVTHWITGKKRAAVLAWSEWLAHHSWTIRLLKVNAEGGMVGIDPRDGELDDESIARVARVLAGMEDP